MTISTTGVFTLTIVTGSIVLITEHFLPFFAPQGAGLFGTGAAG